MKETVTSLAEKVAAGELDAATAGRQMRPLLTTTSIPDTLAKRREGYNEAAIETDPNSFVHVAALYSLGRLEKSDYEMLRAMAVG